MSELAGFQLEAPELILNWGIRPPDLKAIFRERAADVELRRVRAGYYVARCVAFGGLRTMVGFHFSPLSDQGLLNELEFYDNGCPDLHASFALYQRHLELTFGPPRVSPGLFSADLPTYRWHTKRLRVSHWVVERFGPEEHVQILKLGLFAAWST